MNLMRPFLLNKENFMVQYDVYKLKMQNKYKLAHLTKSEDQEPYGINNQILLY